MSARDDLLQLTPERLAVLANRGLVKRAQKLIARGDGPSVELDATGTLTATDKDTVTRLPRDAALRDAICTCPAVGVCRHTVAAVLAYAAAFEARPGPTLEGAGEVSTWSPGQVGDDELEALLGARAVRGARSRARRGVIVDVEGGDGGDGASGVPTAYLPSCTVRFLTRGTLAHARCDCRTKGPCEHFALAVWAFRVTAPGPGMRRTVELLADRPLGSPADASALPVRELAREVLLEGVERSVPHWEARAAQARAPLRKAGTVWLELALEELTELVLLYERRAARYRSERFGAVLAELFARPLAASQAAALPARAIMGAGEPLETELDHLLLVGLGAELLSDGDDATLARVYLADPDTATVLMLERRLVRRGAEEPPVGAVAGQRRAGGGASVAGVAAGRVVTSAAKRRANRELRLGRGGLLKTMVTPQRGGWESLPAPVRMDDFRALRADLVSRPPRLIAPRVLASHVRAVRIDSVGEVGYRPGAQEVIGLVFDPSGEAMLVRRTYRSVAPHALDALAAALRGACGDVRWISGDVSLSSAGFLTMTPFLIVAGDRAIALDLEPERARVELGAAGFALDGEGPGRPLEIALRAVHDLAHQGLRYASPALLGDLRRHARGLDALGRKATALALVQLCDATAALRETGQRPAERAAASAWAAAAIRLHVALEVAQTAGP